MSTETPRQEVIYYVITIILLFTFITMPMWWPFSPTFDCAGNPVPRQQACQEATP